MDKIALRLAALRAEMKKLDIDAWYISGTDPHASEYLPGRWQTREFISGFSGSYGMVAITHKHAALWTDSRYFLQAETQLAKTGIVLQKLRMPDTVSPEKWLACNLEEGARVGIDMQTVSVSTSRNMENSLSKHNIKLVPTPDLLDRIWEKRPLDPQNEIFELPIEFTGSSRKNKQATVVGELQKTAADLHVVSMLDELAWLYNLRGSDVDYNPVFQGFAVLGDMETHLFVDQRKLSGQLLRKLTDEGVSVKKYSEFYLFLEQLENKTILLDPATANTLIYQSIDHKNAIVESTSVVSLLKAKKNDTELAGFKQAMKNDGVVMVEFLFWLKQNVDEEGITEYTVGRKLAELRSKQQHFKGESFPPIVGYKHHGAIVHLCIGPAEALPIEAEGILLFDSGGQYLNGTTDITRTVALGKTSRQQKHDFTMVLKGMIRLSMAKFPVGTKGCHLDILARGPLWAEGMNYGHGTGHGVGHFLNVHEGPMSIRQEYNDNRLEPGHVLSNEPAFYRQGEYGIRTENMMVCVEMENTEYGQFLGFETLTLCPIDTSLILKDLMDREEIEWLNKYHQMVNGTLKPLLNGRLQVFLDGLTVAI